MYRQPRCQRRTRHRLPIQVALVRQHRTAQRPCPGGLLDQFLEKHLSVGRLEDISRHGICRCVVPGLGRCCCHLTVHLIPYRGIPDSTGQPSRELVVSRLRDSRDHLDLKIRGRIHRQVLVFGQAQRAGKDIFDLFQDQHRLKSVRAQRIEAVESPGDSEGPIEFARLDQPVEQRLQRRRLDVQVEHPACRRVSRVKGRLGLRDMPGAGQGRRYPDQRLGTVCPPLDPFRPAHRPFQVSGLRQAGGDSRRRPGRIPMPAGLAPTGDGPHLLPHLHRASWHATLGKAPRDLGQSRMSAVGLGLVPGSGQRLLQQGLSPGISPIDQHRRRSGQHRGTCPSSHLTSPLGTPQLRVPERHGTECALFPRLRCDLGDLLERVRVVCVHRQACQRRVLQHNRVLSLSERRRNLVHDLQGKPGLPHSHQILRQAVQLISDHDRAHCPDGQLR